MDNAMAVRLHSCVPSEVLGSQSTAERKTTAHCQPYFRVAVSRKSVQPGCPWRTDSLSAKFKAPLFNQVARRSPDYQQDGFGAQDGRIVCAGDGRAAHMAEKISVRTESPLSSTELSYPDQRNVDKLSASVSAALEARASVGERASASTSRSGTISAPAQLKSRQERLDAPANAAVDAWSFQAEDFEWSDRRDPITNFSCVGEALTTSYNRIWSLRKKHGLWFAADQESHPKPVWSLEDPDDGDSEGAATNSCSTQTGTTEMACPAKPDSSNSWLLDSSFLVALLDSYDLYSPLCLHSLELMGNSRKLLSLECVIEATQLIRSRIGGLRGVQLELFLYRCIEAGIFVEYYPDTFRDLKRFAQLKQEVMEMRQGQTAASIMALSEQLSISNVATLDRRNMEAAVARRNASIRLLPL